MKGGGSELPVTPKLASTVILLDQMSRVYLTKRPKTMKFLGGFYVFPGGSVELADNVLERNWVKQGKINESFSHAHYVAAARELFEEVGVLLASKQDGSPVTFTKAKEMEYRRQLINGEISFLQMLKQEDLHLELESLKYFGHRVTPENSPIRFETRFFITTLPKGQTPIPDLHEIEEAFWISPDEAIAAYQTGKMPMVSPTLLSLCTIINHKKGGPLMMPDRR